MNLFAHDGIHHKTTFEAVMHVLSQMTFIILASVLVAVALFWFVSRRERVYVERRNNKDEE